MFAGLEPPLGIGAAYFRGRQVVHRCLECALPLAACLCASARLLQLATRVIVFMHRREVHKTTNTARLVALTLANSELRTVGLPEDRVAYDGLEQAGRMALVLSPTAHSTELTLGLAGALPITLIVPDGNWRQTRRMVCNEAQLARLPAVHLPAGLARRFELRKHPQPDRLSTFEAIARALGILEGPKVQLELERILELKVQRTLRTRGLRPESSAKHAGGEALGAHQPGTAGRIEP